MGLDVEAHIVVGLPLSEIEPLIEEDIFDIIELYNLKDLRPYQYEGIIEHVEPHEESEPDGTIVGFIIAESESYWPVEIGLGVLAEKHIRAATSFYGLFKKTAKVYLVPRQW